MQTYLFAANLFTLTAFLLGLNNFSKGAQSWRLLPLFLLAISQSISLIISLAELSASAPLLMAALNIFSAACLIWALINTANLVDLWQKALWLAGGGALVLAILPLLPGWPIPFQIHNLIIAMGGMFFILVSLDRVSWVHLAAPLLLSAGNLLSLLNLNTPAWFVMLLAYGLLIAALHWESIEQYRQREKASTAVVRQAVNLSQERQRLLEVSEIISAVPGLEHSMTHVVRSMAHVTHADQAAIFTLDIDIEEWLRLIAIYSPERPVYLTNHDEITFELADCPPLQIGVITQRQQLFSPYQSSSDLESLYSLWHENRTGPTLVQPLTVQGKTIGVLVLGNPVTQQSFLEDDLVLCRSLAAQIATMVEAYRRYIDLELRAKQKPHLLDAPPTQPLAGPKTEMEPEADLALKLGSTPAVAKPFLHKPSPRSGGAAAPLAGPALAMAAKASPPAGRTTRQWMAPMPEPETGAMESYLSILDTVEEGVIVSDARGQVRLANKAAERILGKSRQELLDQSIETIYHVIDPGEGIENLAGAFSRRNEPLPTFVEYEDRTIQGQLVPWRNEEKEWLGIIAIFKDVTPTVKADQARNNFIMALSRVLRGPLTLIRGYAELTTTGLLEEYSAEQLQVQKIIHNSVERVIETLDNAIQISSQNKNKILPRFELVNIIKVINKALQETTSLAHLREVKLVREVKGELPVIVADPAQLLRILANLLSNACHFTPPGGRVALRAWVQQERTGNVTRPQLILAVADNGVGIPPTELKRIFEPFYQLNNQPPGQERGMGMGLTVTKELVELHRGKIWAESTLGEGSTFYVALPIDQDLIF
jgi:PAS domain S-box-containing protein